MKLKELIQRLSRLQSRTYNIQSDIQIIIGELEMKKEEGRKKE